MDIKNVAKGMLSPQIRLNEKVERMIRSDSTTDRDANGQMPSGGQQGEDQGPMSDEHIAKCIEHLKSLPTVKDHHLVVELQIHESKKFVIIRESDGKVIRRISEPELRTLQFVNEKEKGQLLRKTA